MQTRKIHWLDPSLIIDSKLPPDFTYTQVTDISSEATPGTVFFAVRGKVTDGHRFLAEVIQQGAAAVVVETEEAYRKFPRAIWVKSTRKAYALAACEQFDHPSRKLSLVGITGTNGKTTTTSLLEQIGSLLGKKIGLIGTIGNKIAGAAETSSLTTPSAFELQKLLQRMVQAGVTHAFMEVSSIAIDQFRTAGSSFEGAVFTNLTQDHLDYHGDMETYIRAKQSFFQDPGLKWRLSNIDDSTGKLFHENFGGLSFSRASPKADYFVNSLMISSVGSHFTLKTPRQEYSLRSSLTGNFNLYNAGLALASADLLGWDMDSVTSVFSQCPGARGRLERVVLEGCPFSVFVDYAHSEDALRNVLECLREVKNSKKAGRVITVFGCGGDRDKSKRIPMGKTVSQMSEITIATSDNPRTEDPSAILSDIEQGIDRSSTVFHRIQDRKEAIHFALDLAQEEDIVLIAGKGHETYQILGKEKIPFDDRQIVQDFF
jgi:UDP-N-acetylmuramoyl-L-alanyl-D-glutamate--2,6-diaminopimelate ligase